MALPHSPAIKAVLFDFAGVITAPIGDALHRLASEAGADVTELSAFLIGDYDSPAALWHRVERGEATVTELHDWGVAEGKARGWDLDLRGFVQGMVEAELRTEIVRRASELRRQGYRTALVTNNIREVAPVWSARIPVADMFDTVVDSSAVGMRKPSPEIFHLTLDRLGVSPPEAVLLDDMAVNVDAARALGMHAIHVGPETSEALAELDRLLR